MPTELATELPAMKVHFTEWMANRLKIISKKGDMVSLVPNQAQLRLFAIMEAQRAAGLPMRVIVLKSRRQGVSTGFNGYAFTQVQNNPNSKAFVCAHDGESSDNLFYMNRIFEQNLPDCERKPKQRSNKREILWDHPHWSTFKVQTAGKLELGRSELAHYLHCSELGFWGEAKTALTAVMQIVPPLPETAILIESTANGVGGEFHERWEAAVKRWNDTGGSLDGFVPLFLSWLEDPDNVMAVPKDYVWGEFTEEERYLLAYHKPTREQLYWRRWTLHNAFNGDTELFKQEDPSSPEEAFLHSGRRAIPAVITRYHRSLITEPRRCRLYWDSSASRGVRADYGEFVNNCWLVWKEPREGRDYTVGGDLGTGQLSSPSNRRSEPDANAGVVIDRHELEIVAARMDREYPDVFGEEMVKAAWYYNEAWASPEINEAGYAALAAFRRLGYNRTFQRQVFEDYLRVEDAERLGWKTGTANRDQMIDDFIAACRPNWRPYHGAGEADFEGKLRVYWEEFVRQEETFEIDKRGKRQHRDGQFDDALFAAFIAWQIHLRVPRTSDAGTPNFITVPRTAKDLCTPNAVDVGADVWGAPAGRILETV